MWGGHEREPVRGQYVVVRNEKVPDTAGRVTVYRTKIDPGTDPVPPHIEDAVMNNTPSDTLRQIFADVIAELRGQK